MSDLEKGNRQSSGNEEGAPITKIDLAEYLSSLSEEDRIALAQRIVTAFDRLDTDWHKNELHRRRTQL